jgi:hypothetical protein
MIRLTGWIRFYLAVLLVSPAVSLAVLLNTVITWDRGHHINVGLTVMALPVFVLSTAWAGLEAKQEYEEERYLARFSYRAMVMQQFGSHD